MGRKDFLGKEVFKRREVLTNKRGRVLKKKKRKEKEKKRERLGRAREIFERKTDRESWWKIRLFSKHFSFFKRAGLFGGEKGILRQGW